MASLRCVVTGGAGYIGSHLVRALRLAGFEVCVIDDLSTGVADRVAGLELIQMDIATAPINSLASVMKGADCVFHLAARKRSDQSVLEPVWYFRQNVSGLVRLLEAIQRAQVPALVFSSSSAVYGQSECERVGEEQRLAPCNPYGETKLVGEWLCRDACTAWGLRSVSLRNFNVAGVSWPDLFEQPSHALVPQSIRRIADRRPIHILGRDYPTRDGTCLRDYVHVGDVVEAHILAADCLMRAIDIAPEYNVCSGVATSVLEVVTEAENIVGTPADLVFKPRRIGDPPVMVGDATRISSDLGWSAKSSLRDIVYSTYCSLSTTPRSD